jgi:hypothetical protein
MAVRGMVNSQVSFMATSSFLKIVRAEAPIQTYSPKQSNPVKQIWDAFLRNVRVLMG